MKMKDSDRSKRIGFLYSYAFWDSYAHGNIIICKHFNKYFGYCRPTFL